MKLAIAIVLVALVPSIVGAKEQEKLPITGASVAKDTPVGAEDEDVYRCKQYPAGAKIKVTFKPETELKELVSWAMGFSCRQFVMSTTITQRSQKVTIVSPNEMTPQEGMALFLTALEEMNLTLVRRGPSQTFTIVESTSAKERPSPSTTRATAAPRAEGTRSCA
jgi:hypothetical protein